MPDVFVTEPPKPEPPKEPEPSSWIDRLLRDLKAWLLAWFKKEGL